MLNLDALNRDQQKAVLTTQGPVLVLAGAGSGKTRVITYRLAKLIDEGVPASAILAVTFTNKAAREMKERARALVGSRQNGAVLSTFHSFCARLLREFPERVGLRPGFTISDAGDHLGSVRRILRDLRIDDRRFDADRIVRAMSKAKNAGMTATVFRDHHETLDLAELADPNYAAAAIECYTRYEAALRAQNVVDFDDLLLLAQQLLDDHADIREQLCNRHRFVMVDEVQDTNAAQFHLLKHLAGKAQNICVVGDDDQSIYGWRGANLENILRFEQHFPRAVVIKLLFNYRSTANILSVGNAVIAGNARRHDKQLRAVAGEGARVQILSTDDEDAEAAWVARSIQTALLERVPASEIAILCRSNVQTRPFELALREQGVSYRVVGGLELFDKKEIRDLLAYLRVLDNPEDEQSLRRILNYPPRGIGETAVAHIDDWCREHNATFSVGLRRAAENPGVTPRTVEAIARFVDVLERHRKMLRDDPEHPAKVARHLVEATGLLRALMSSSDNPGTSARRVDAVREVLRHLESVPVDSLDPAREPSDARPSPRRRSLHDFLSEMALSKEGDDLRQEDGKQDEVVLSTIHAAKGLEWKRVYLVGAEEELLPHRRAIDESCAENDVDEERRLAYVAITRAKEKLTITWAKTRTRYGRMVPRERSRFLEGLPDAATEWLQSTEPAQRSEEEKHAIAEHFMAKIREQLKMG